MTRMRSVLALCLGVFSAGAAQACGDLVAIDRAQITDLMTVVRDQDADPLDQFFAFETLMCSDQSGIRDLTLRTGLKSPNPTIQAQVVLRAMLEKESVFIHLLEVDGLSKEQYERITARPSETLPIQFKDPGAACFSFHDNRGCNTASLMSVNGTLVTIRTRWNSYDLDGNFSLNDGKLTGQLTFAREKLTYPAEINLF